MTRLLPVVLGAIALLAAALALAVGAFLRGLDLDGEFLRTPLERALTAAFDVPTRIEGPLRLHTGRTAIVSARALVLADPSGADGATLARGVAPRAGIDLLSLLRRVVSLQEVSGERLELTLRRRADGTANWRQLFSASDGSARVTFAGIERLRIGSVVGSYQRDGEPSVPFVIDAFDGAVPLDEPLRASGAARIAGQEIGVDLRTASLNGLGSTTGLPLQGALKWAGAQATIDGRLVDGATRLQVQIEATAADASALLAVLGINAQDPGPLALSGQFSATAGQASVRELVVSLGRSKAAGSAVVAWDGPRPSIETELKAEHLDAAPFFDGTPRTKGIEDAEEWVARLERLAAGTEATVDLTVAHLAGLPVAANDLRLDMRSGGHVLAAKAAGVVAGTPVEATLELDARKARRTLAARIDGGAVSTASLPRQARPGALSVTVGKVRGRMRGTGESPATIVASLQGEFDARDVRWTFGDGRQPPIAGRFDVVRIALPEAGSSSAEVSGRIDGAACAAKISGGATAPLLAGEPWPVKFSATCPNERLSARGRLALAGRHATADLTFDVSGDRSGPVARAAGLPSFTPYPIDASGTLALDARQARLRLAAFRVGRSTGSGEIVYPLGAAGTPSLRLALATLNLDEIAVERGTGGADVEPAERRLVRSNHRLADGDFDLVAERIEFGSARLTDFKLSGAMRARRVSAAPFRIDWDGIALRGEVGLDVSGSRPQLSITGSAQDVDLGPLLARFGVDAVRVNVGQLSLSARAEGERPRELLASLSLEASAGRAQVELQRPLLPGATSRGALDATFSAAPGRPSRFAARGSLDGQPLELAAEGPSVEVLAQEREALPFALRSSVGDIGFEAEGRFARDGSVDARVRLAGERLDELGRLVGLALPEVAPYDASADVRLAPGTADLSGLQASFGSSRITGQLNSDWRSGARPLHTATLHASVLHLEDIGAGGWLGERGRTAPAGAEAQPVQQVVERLLALLPQADLGASIEVDALLGGGQKFASGHILATVSDGLLHARLLDVLAQDGTTNAELLVDAGASPPKFSLRADVRDVEYGALARAMKPHSQLNGTVDVAADLSAQSAPADLLQALKGTIDFAVFPRDMKSDALGLWGAGLLPAILRAVERDSRAQVHCSVLGFAVADGVARSDGFFVETTGVRIIGDLEVRLGSWEIAGRIDPRRNRLQFFAFSPRLQIGGALGSPSLSVAPESLVLVPLRFAAPLALFSDDWHRGGSCRSRGSTGCREAFARVLEAHHGRAPVR